MRTGKKRYISSFIKKNKNGELAPNVVVVTAHNEVLAKATLCTKYDIPNIPVKRNERTGEYGSEGIKSIRLSETNTYEGMLEGDVFGEDSES
jgi:hypothetical protein